MAAVCSATVEVGADGDVTSFCKYFKRQQKIHNDIWKTVILMLIFGVVMYHVHQLNLTKPYSKSTISLKLYFKYLQIVQHYSEM